jgi:hypothetical protein
VCGDPGVESPLQGLNKSIGTNRRIGHKVDTDLFFAANAEGVDAEVIRNKNREREGLIPSGFIAFQRGRNTT